jgi:hypothetical protein
VLMKSSLISLMVLVQLGANAPAFAWPFSLTVNSGEGEEAVYKRGLLGNRRTMVKDRFGDKYENKRGIFGLSKDNELGVLGNGARYHKGILGNKETDVHTMFGDSVKYKKNVFGWRSANVDLHGVSSLLDRSVSRPSVPPQSGGLPIPSDERQPGNLERLEPEGQPDSSLPTGGIGGQEGLPLK